MLRFRKKFGIGVLLFGVCLLGGSCRRDMQDQPKMKPYRGTSFFGDGLAMRQPIPGTIPRGYLRSDKALFTGKKDTTSNTSQAAQATPAPTPPGGTTNVYTDDTDTFPF